ncbi:MAG: HAD family hydrolase [Chloroflexi bacterium]|nr:HAD family hydrolase [Chloroflexota bacterium]
MRPAVFFDRDGTLIQSVHYLSRPDQVRLVPGAGAVLATLRSAGWVTVLVTNQAAIGKGIIDEKELGLIHDEMSVQFAVDGGKLDGIYYSPHVQQGPGREFIEHPDRKPGPGMLTRAARELQLDLRLSWMVGDAVTDMLAGRNAGCAATVLITGGSQRAEDEKHAAVDHVIDSVADLPALMFSLGAAGGGY